MAIARERIAREAEKGTGELDLRDLGLTILPEALWNLRQLQVLLLGTRPLSAQETADAGLGLNRIEQLPPALARLVNLQQLGLRGLEIANLAPIADLARLRDLDICGTKVADFAPIAHLPSLQYLRAAGTPVASLAPIARLGALHHLDVADTEITNLRPIAGIYDLKKIDISRTRITSLSGIGPGKLEELRMSGTTVTDLTPLINLRELRRLSLSNCPISDIEAFWDLESLRQLDLSGTQVVNLAPISRLGLEDLDVSGTLVADLTPVIGFRRLRRLNARGAKVRAVPQGLGAIRTLESDEPGEFWGLHLEGNPLEDPLPRLIAPGQPEATRNVLAWLRGELDPDTLPDLQFAPLADDDDPPEIPSEGAGRHVVIDQTGRLLPAPPGSLDRDGNLLPRLRALHPALREAAGDLVASLDAGNRPHPRLLQRATAYRASVEVDLAAVNFSALFAIGVQLDNAARRVRKAAADGHLNTPELPLAAEEALDTILELHPGFIAASRDGSEMLADQTLIQLTATDMPVLAEVAGTVARELAARPDLAAPALPAAISAAAGEIAASPTPQRDATTTIAMTRNVVIAVGQCAVVASLPVVGAGVAAVFGGGAIVGTAVGVVLALPAAESVKKTKQFEELRRLGTASFERMGDREFWDVMRRLKGHRDLMLRTEPALRRLSGIPGFAWLNDTLDWIKRQPNDPPPN